MLIVRYDQNLCGLAMNGLLLAFVCNRQRLTRAIGGVVGGGPVLPVYSGNRGQEDDGEQPRECFMHGVGSSG